MYLYLHSCSTEYHGKNHHSLLFAMFSGCIALCTMHIQMHHVLVCTRILEEKKRRRETERLRLAGPQTSYWNPLKYSTQHIACLGWFPSYVNVMQTFYRAYMYMWLYCYIGEFPFPGWPPIAQPQSKHFFGTIIAYQDCQPTNSLESYMVSVTLFAFW